MTDNEDVLVAFREFLDGDDLAGIFGHETLVGILREFGEVIEPVSLAEATCTEMNIFIRDHGQVEAGRNRLEDPIQRQIAELRRMTYKAAMLLFKHFRLEVLRRARGSTNRRPFATETSESVRSSLYHFDSLQNTSLNSNITGRQRATNAAPGRSGAERHGC